MPVQCIDKMFIMKGLPIAKTELREIIEDDCPYVDKTLYIKKLVDEKQKYYFLSRPRRFGKSLFLDTMKEAFEGNKELFKGMYLENNWNWDEKYPVIKISFAGGTVTTVDELNQSLDYSLRKIANGYNIELKESYIPKKFDELITKLKEKFDEIVVILIDEYDKPILDNLTKDNVDILREQLSSFYSVLKEASAYLKFVFLTGVSRFSKTSIFSKLNNLTDITLVPKYADICGISQDDLENVFTDYLQDVDLKKVKQWYDGYNFLGNQLYNPYDVLMFLWDKRYKSYWFETGTPTFLLDLIKQRKFFIPTLEKIEVFDSQLSEFEINNIQLEVLLFHTGYLTIKNVQQITDKYLYTLAIPNKEVRIGFNDSLLRSFYAAMFETYQRTGLSKNLYFSIANKNPGQMRDAFYSLFAGMPHQWFIRNKINEYEGFYCSMFYAFFASLGLDFRNEDTTNKGRIDFTVLTNDAVFVFEIKMKRISENAFQQIKQREYHEKYLSENKDIFLIGIEFDEDEKNIPAFEHEKISTQ